MFNPIHQELRTKVLGITSVISPNASSFGMYIDDIQSLTDLPQVSCATLLALICISSFLATLYAARSPSFSFLELQELHVGVQVRLALFWQPRSLPLGIVAALQRVIDCLFWCSLSDGTARAGSSGQGCCSSP